MKGVNSPSGFAPSQLSACQAGDALEPSERVDCLPDPTHLLPRTV